ncbi:iojap-like ribosome-associated protein [Rubidibacter lacunae KORDI 51-2]|uniref:Ribosomal silencing factor RsfS n=1 Tax=Rubidibacter lacunae KORDI 51-2 TaxID=582515 RepID=U5DNG7_9CHRO|nr:ribosome silencing factor [Rubidibacter lacunae]ERN42417.1 iojap-like ribosome-associated protein [Rubidibacter lacunae KORDI 51-2]
MRETDRFDNATALFPNVHEQTDSERLALTIARAADDRKAGDIILLYLRDVSYLADFFTVATGYSRAQVKAIADSIQERVAEDLHQQPLRVEGQSDRSWILLDYGDAIAHVMLEEEREFYNIEAFWGHADRIEFAALPDCVRTGA